MKILDGSAFVPFVTARRIPTTAQLEVTSQCHLTCVHCKSVVHDRNTELSTESWKAIIDELKTLGTTSINFTGGEVFLRPDFLDLVEYAESLGFKVSMLTTATLITEARIERLLGLKKLKRIAISLYSLRPEVHQAITQSNTLKKSLSTLLKMRSLGLPAEAQCVVLEDNWRDVQTLRSFCQERDIPLRTTFLVYPRDDGFAGTRDRKPSAQVIAHLSRSFQPFENQTFDCGGVEPENSICSVGRTVVGVTAKGEYLPCPSFRLPFGDLSQGTLSGMWRKSEGMEKILSLRKKEVVCHDCEASKKCFHCTGLALAEVGNDLEKLLYPQSACEVTYARRRGALHGS